MIKVMAFTLRIIDDAYPSYCAGRRLFFGNIREVFILLTSLLFPTTNRPTVLNSQQAFFTDLHLDQLLAVVRHHLDGRVAAALLQPLNTPAEITYRQAIFADLRQPEIRQACTDFATQMHRLDEQRAHLPQLFSTESRWLSLVALLRDTEETIHRFTVALTHHELHAPALIALRAYLVTYAQSPATQQRQQDLERAHQAVANLTYRLEFHGRRVTVLAHPHPTQTLADALITAFGDVMPTTNDLNRPVKLKAPEPVGRLNNLQISVVNELVKLYPAEFAILADFQRQYGHYRDELLHHLAPELTFYLAWLHLQDHVQQALNVSFCLPTLINHGTEAVTASFDFNLAVNQLQADQPTIVTNDYCLNPTERFLIISGPNQGGKTTYARMVGELYYLSRLGIPVPGQKATLRLRPQLATHFDRPESGQPLNGLLANDIDRIHTIIAHAVPGEFVIMNELFSSTTTKDATDLAQRVLAYLAAKDVCGIYVTFLTQLTTLPATVGMMSQLTEGTQRTYKVVRHSLDDHAYATALLQHYHLTAADLKGGNEHAR